MLIILMKRGGRRGVKELDVHVSPFMVVPSYRFRNAEGSMQTIDSTQVNNCMSKKMLFFWAGYMSAKKQRLFKVLRKILG